MSWANFRARAFKSASPKTITPPASPHLAVPTPRVPPLDVTDRVDAMNAYDTYRVYSIAEPLV